MGLGEATELVVERNVARRTTVFPRGYCGLQKGRSARPDHPPDSAHGRESGDLTGVMSATREDGPGGLWSAKNREGVLWALCSRGAVSLAALRQSDARGMGEA